MTDEPKEGSKINYFLTILIVSIFLIVCAYIWTSKEYKDRQQKIIDAQNCQLSKLDSIMGSFYSQSMQLSKDTAYYKVLMDSISKSKNHKQVFVDSIVKSIISASIKTQANKELTNQLRKDSIFVQTQIGQIQNDTKIQLTLEFNKLQNEYYTLQLWGGILTIVFLIFTFYSLFKTDDLVKQGRDGLEKLNDQRDKAIELNKKTTIEFEEFKEQITNFKRDLEKIDKNKEKQKNEIKGIQIDISTQKEQLIHNLKLKEQYEELLANIADAQKEVLELQTKNKNNLKSDDSNANAVNPVDQEYSLEIEEKLDDEITESDSPIK